MFHSSLIDSVMCITYVFFLFFCFFLLFDLNNIKQSHRRTKLIELNSVAFYNAITLHFRRQKIIMGTRLNVNCLFGLLSETSICKKENKKDTGHPANKANINQKMMHLLKLDLLKRLQKVVNTF